MALDDEYVDEVLSDLEDEFVEGVASGEETDADMDDELSDLIEVGAIEEVGARRIRSARGRRNKARMFRRAMRAARKRIPAGARGLPSPPFGRSQRSTERRAPLGFKEEGTGANFFSLPNVVNSVTTMIAKVSREAHADRLLIVPSAPGVVFQSIKVGDEEQLLAPGAPVELYSTAALTDAVPDNFSPLSSALDFSVVLQNTTNVAITGTIGIKAAVKR